MDTIKLTLPCIIYTGKRVKKKFSLSWNYFCNLHKNARGKIKQAYMQMCYLYMPKEPIKNIESITYTLYTTNHRTCDVGNVCGLVDKFFCDSMIEYGILKDDNFNEVPKVIYQYGGIAKERVVEVIISLKK